MSDEPKKRKRPASTSPTQRSLQRLRKDGYTAGVVEKTIPKVFPPKKLDLFGAIDIVAIAADQLGVLGVQATSASNQASRRTKALALPAIRLWLATGNRFEVWGWRKKGAKGARKLWEVNILKLKLEDFPP